MIICDKCGAQLADNAKFCGKCGSPVPSVPPAAEQAGGPSPKKKSVGKKILTVMLCILAAALIGTAGYFAVRWYISPEQQSLRAIKANNFDLVKDLVDDHDSVADDDDVVASLRQRAADVNTDFTSGAMTYSDACKVLDDLIELDIDDVTKDVLDVKSKVEALNQSRTDFDTAQTFFDRGDYPEAIEHYKKVIDTDANYQTAKSKITEASDLYRAKVLQDAADCADREAYSDAVSVLNTALTVLPGDAQISKQVTIYEKDNAEQIKAQTLSEAAGLAELGKYSEAMSSLDRYMDENGADTDVSKAYNGYYESYIQAVLAEADQNVTDEGYLAAMAKVKDALKIAVDDDQLQKRLQTYEANYSDEVIEQANALVAEKKYDDALTMISDASDQIENNDNLTIRWFEIFGLKPQYLLNVCQPYEKSGCDAYQGSDSFKVAGKDQMNGLMMKDTSSYVFFNLEGSFDVLEFDVGHIDGSVMSNCKIMIEVDGTVVKVIELNATDMPQHFSVDISGCKQMKISYEYTWNGGQAKYGLYEMTVHKEE